MMDFLKTANHLANDSITKLPLDSGHCFFLDPYKMCQSFRNATQ